MNRYYRGNLAVEVDHARSKQKRTMVIKTGIPAGEKLFYLFMISLIVLGCGFVAMRYIQISQYNYLIQDLKVEIAKTEEANSALQLQVDRMSSREKILSEAEKMGMVHSPEAVRVIGEDPGASRHQDGLAN